MIRFTALTPTPASFAVLLIPWPAALRVRMRASDQVHPVSI
jgi:hypothetical protein